MKRALVVVAAIVAALVVGLGLGQILLARDGGEGVTAPSELVSVVASLGSSVHTFGDPVDARVDVVVDTREVDLGSVRLQPTFDPYEQVGPPHVTREQFGPLGRIRYDYRLVCLKEGCDAAEARGVTDFQSGRLRYRFADRTGNAFEVFDWPLLEVASRVADADVEDIRWRADETTLPAVSYRVPPLGAALVLIVVAFACAGAAVLLARRLWWPQRADDSATDDGGPVRSALEQAFDVAFRAADNGDSPERRRALERVARELSAQGRTDIVGEARELAWSPASSTSEQIEGLATRAGVSGLDGKSA